MRDKIKGLWIRYKALAILVCLLVVILFATSSVPAKEVTVKSDNSYLSSHVTIRVNVEMEKDK